MKRSRLGTVVLGLGLAGAAALLHSSCGSGSEEVNLFRPISKPGALKSNTKAKLEEARVDLDKRDYAGALAILQAVVDDPGQDSDEARVLFAGATLGNSGLDVWSIISDVLTQLDQASSKRTNGLDQVLNALSDSVLGTGAVRAAKVQAMHDALAALAAAPTPGDPHVGNTACIVAAFLAVPTVADATAAVQSLQTALNQLGQTSSCPNVTPVTTALTGITTAATSFNDILEAASSCTFLDLAKTQAQMNSIEKSLNYLMKTADKGCPAVPAGLPGSGCLQQALTQSVAGATAGDGKLAPCEIVLNCANPSVCFKAP